MMMYEPPGPIPPEPEDPSEVKLTFSNEEVARLLRALNAAYDRDNFIKADIFSDGSFHLYTSDTGRRVCHGLHLQLKDWPPPNWPPEDEA